jgi:hypothetical protein
MGSAIDREPADVTSVRKFFIDMFGTSTDFVFAVTRECARSYRTPY